MANNELPSEYDAIVLGTGMTESIIAAALARIGWKVLHLDRNDYYSGDWASFSFQSFLTWVKDIENGLTALSNESTIFNNDIKSDEKLIELEISSNSIRIINRYCFIPESICQKVLHKEGSTSDSGEVGSYEKEQDALDETYVDTITEIPNETASNPDILNGEGTSLDEILTDFEEKIDMSSCQETSQEQCSKSESAHVEGNQIKNPEFKKWSMESLMKESRKFSIDLTPRLLYCRGEMVELLISSDVTRYCQFRCLSRVITQIDGNLKYVPCSRADVFNNKEISMLEKHMLMKLLTKCMEFDESDENITNLKNLTFKEYLASQKLSNNIQHYVFNAIAMAEHETSAYEGLLSTKKFLQSLGRYGNTAFLWPIYGSGELPQCFCRLCAVFGGIYCLKRAARSLIVNSDNECTGIVDTEGQILKAKNIIMEASYASIDICPSISENQRKISRAILLTNKSVLNDFKQEDLTLFRIPSYEHLKGHAILIELSSVSMACPKDIYIVYISCICSSNAEDDLKPIVNDYFHCENNSSDIAPIKPNVLWCIYFEQFDNSHIDYSGNLKGAHLISGPDFHLDFDFSVRQAKSIFTKICPDEEFLPRAPDPEDIIFEDGEKSQESTNDCIETVAQNNENCKIEEQSQSVEGDYPENTDESSNVVD